MSVPVNFFQLWDGKCTSSQAKWRWTIQKLQQLKSTWTNHLKLGTGQHNNLPGDHSSPEHCQGLFVVHRARGRSPSAHTRNSTGQNEAANWHLLKPGQAQDCKLIPESDCDTKQMPWIWPYCSAEKGAIKNSVRITPAAIWIPSHDPHTPGRDGKW